jgi:hypothetical protein
LGNFERKKSRSLNYEVTLDISRVMPLRKALVLEVDEQKQLNKSVMQ